MVLDALDASPLAGTDAFDGAQMNPVRRKRLMGVIVAMLVAGIGVALLLSTMRRHIEYYQTPSQVNRSHPVPIMLGGLVEKGSVRHPSPLMTQFRVRDQKQSMVVRYQGVLPALFREGQGVIMHGQLNASGVFMANQVLAKHDQYYRPPGLAKVDRRLG